MIRRILTYLVEHQIEFPLRIIGALILAYTLKIPIAEKTFILQHQIPKTCLYEKGIDDIYFVAFWVLLFTLLRALVMKFILIPISIRGGITKKKRIRFAEQGWSFLYYITFWTLGMYIMYQSPHWFDTSHFWKGYPHVKMSYIFKWYYLVQFAFWVQQIFVLNIEKRRKDFSEMLAHHMITVSLMFSSYIFNFTRIGNAVLCIMDFADILLPLAKMLKYLKYNKSCDTIFGFFMISWLITRHYFYGYVIYSTWVESTQYLELKWSPDEEYFFNKNTKSMFLFFFIALQAIIIFWFCLIFNVALRVIYGNNAEDDRSDSEKKSLIINHKSSILVAKKKGVKIVDELTSNTTSAYNKDIFNGGANLLDTEIKSGLLNIDIHTLSVASSTMSSPPLSPFFSPLFSQTSSSQTSQTSFPQALLSSTAERNIRRSTRIPKPSRKFKEQQELQQTQQSTLGKRDSPGPETVSKKRQREEEPTTKQQMNLLLEKYKDRIAILPELEEPNDTTRNTSISTKEVFKKWSSIEYKIFLLHYFKHGKDLSIISKKMKKKVSEVVEFYYYVKYMPHFRKVVELRKEMKLYEEGLAKLENDIKNFNKKWKIVTKKNGKKRRGCKK
nr:10515_t:CDS:2 [Entrophospora candida]